MSTFDAEVEITKTNGRLDTLASQYATLVQSNSSDHKEFREKLDRPSWAVTVMFSLLSAVSTGLGVFVMTH